MHSQAMNANTGALRFTPDMIRDQEMLVSSMSQQGISEDLIRRQYERLLEEQTKQLRFMKEEPVREKADPEKVVESKKCDQKAESDGQMYNTPSGESSVTATYNQLANQAEAYKTSHWQEAANQQQSQPSIAEDKPGPTHPIGNAAENAPLARVEPSSLLKIRLKKELLNTQKRNNGLQEAATALKIIKESKSKIAQDRLNAEAEYLLRLNGTQERTAAEQTQFSHMTEGANLHNNTENQRKVQSANGLENSRNLDNPPSRRFCPHPSHPGCTPTPGSMPMDKSAEYHPHQNSTLGAATAATGHHEPMPQQTNDPHNQQNSLHSELHEPRVIGGFTYFARKPQCIPKFTGYTPGYSPNQSHQISSQANQRTALPMSH